MSNLDNDVQQGFRDLFTDLHQAEANVRNQLNPSELEAAFSEGIGGQIHTVPLLPLHFLATTEQRANNLIRLHFFEQSRDDTSYSFDPDNTSTYEITETGVLVSRFSPATGISIKALAKDIGCRELKNLNPKDSGPLIFYRFAVEQERLDTTTAPTRELELICRALRAPTSHGIAFHRPFGVKSPASQYGLHLPQENLQRADFPDIHIRP